MLREAARLEVLEVARHVDRLDRAEAHRHGRELPEIRHQPGVRIGRHALAVDLAAEIVQLVLRQAPLEQRARIDAGRGMALEIDQVAAVALVRGVPEMILADAEQRADRGEARDVAAELVVVLVGAHHHRHRVPAAVRADALLDRRVARRALLEVRRDGVDVRGVGRVRQVGAGAARLVDQLLEQEVRALGALALDHRLERVEPLLRLERVGIVCGGNLRDGGH